MNTPNKLTLVRIALVPVFLIFLLVDAPLHYFGAFLVFGAASLTDYYDGKLARRDNLITDFGKFLDPIADKLLTTAALLGFLDQSIGWGTIWVVFIVLAREFLISSLRMIAASRGTVLAADIWGKAKTVFQMATILVILFLQGILEVTGTGYWLYLPCQWFYTVLLWVSAMLTALSGVNYLVKNKDCIDFRS